MALLLLPFLAAHIVFPLSWFAILAQHGPPHNDWRHFQIVAEHFVAGDLARLYSDGPDAINPGHIWRYPPFALYFVAPLAWLTPTGAYWLLLIVGIGAAATSMLLLARIAPPRGMSAEWVLAIALSAPMLSMLANGQNSALLMLCVVLAAHLWTRGRVVVACALLGLLALKPNWGLFFGAFALARREWRGTAVMVVVVFGLCTVTLPLGFNLWIDFVERSIWANNDVLARYEPFKVITLKGFFDALLGTSRLSFFVWGASALVLVATTTSAWRTQGPPARHLALAMLLAVAANPYASFYDALVLAFPATLWWSERDTWRRGPWLGVGTLIAIAWCWEQYVYGWRNIAQDVGILWLPQFSIVGPAVTVWLLLAAREAHTQRHAHHTGVGLS